MLLPAIVPVFTNHRGGRLHRRAQCTSSAPARPRPRARRACPEPQRQSRAPPSSGSPRPHRHFEPHIRATGISGDGLQLSQAGSVFELRFPQLCPCLRSCQCSPTTAADVCILVRKVVRERQHRVFRALERQAWLPGISVVHQGLSSRSLETVLTLSISLEAAKVIYRTSR